MNVQMKQIAVLSTDLANQKSITQLREEQIALQEQKLLARDTIIYQQDQVLLADQLAIKKANRALKRQRTLTKITGVLGIVGIVVALIL
jgi:imidazoleglycerol phosphate synthase glutamine amidotransferase subunit HisH